jgi:transcriptional regulator with XRE-family HTH domain/Zn-dependent peptidase ImmA (M78 family)
MAKTKNVFEPDYAIAPGVTLKETLEAKGMLQSDLCMRTGMNAKTVSDIISGDAPITLETADKFELVLGIPARFWNNRELRFRESLAREQAAERLSKDIAWLRTIPVKELIDRNYVVATDDKAGLVRQVLKFFGVSSVEAWGATWGAPGYQFRGGKVQEKHPAKVAAWLRMGEIEAMKVKCNPYDAKRFRSALQGIRKYADKPATEWLPVMIKLCAEAGVAVVFVPQIPGASVSGATRWVSKDKAIIMLSLKYKTDDHLWFTFFHEAAHVLLHGKKIVFIEDGETSNDRLENEADKFARDALISPSKVPLFPKLKGRIDIRSFAQSIRVSPGIVVGRLQRDGYLSHKYCNDLKVNLEWPDSLDEA